MAKSPQVTVSMQLASLTDGRPVAGAPVRLCALNDYGCTSPSPQTFTTDTSGIATLTLDAPFGGYFDVQAQNFVPELILSTPAIAETTLPGTQLGFTMLPSAQLASLVMPVVPMLDPSLGMLFVSPTDCAGDPAPNVSFTGTNLGPSAVPYYVINGGSLDGQATATTAAPPGGGLVGGGWLQVQPGVVTVTATVGGAGVATQGMPVRAGALTVAVLVPTP